MAARGCCSPRLLSCGGKPGGGGGSALELVEPQPATGTLVGPPRAPGAPAGPGERQTRVPAGRG
eukprot:3139804-Alexandrium_andersonii.AAC.1